MDRVVISILKLYKIYHIETKLIRSQEFLSFNIKKLSVILSLLFVFVYISLFLTREELIHGVSGINTVLEPNFLIYFTKNK